MRLRSLSKHVKEQNWLAVCLDFFIVVAGVFIGIQLGNWNESRSDQIEYNLALDRYRAEIRENLQRLDTVATHNRTLLDITETGFDALLTCQNTPENRALVNRALNSIMGTVGLKLQTNALEALTDDPKLLAQQSEEDRSRLANTQFMLNVFLREADFLEVIPLEERAQNNPLIKIGNKEKREVIYAGADFSRIVRLIELNAPINVACRDDALIKSFYSWERWQGAMPATIRVIREQLDKNLEYFGE